MRVNYTRLFSDSSGASHFQNLESDLTATDFASNAPPLFVSLSLQAENVSFFGAPAGWKSDWHPSSGRHLFAVLSGVWEVTATDSEVRRFSRGDVLLVEDTEGKGHTSRVIGDEDSLALLIKL
jgi:quercetin dioxygenase-like cupin family protein